MSLKYITSKNIQDGCERVRGWFLLRGHNFISLGVPKGHNPDLHVCNYYVLLQSMMLSYSPALIYSTTFKERTDSISSVPMVDAPILVSSL